MFYLRIHFVCFLIFRLTCIDAQPLLWNIKNINRVKKDKSSYIYKQVIKNANNYVNLSPLSVVNKKRQFVEDTHYYVSIGTYWWPDSSDSNRRYIRRDGYVNPETKGYDRARLIELAERLKFLSLAYYFESQERYYDSFVRLLREWFCNDNTYMYPNLDYAQVVPGQNHDKGRAAGLIEARSFNDVLESIRVLEMVRLLDWDTKSTVKWWFYKFSQWMQSSEIGIEENKASNNQGIAYDVILLDIALFTDQKALLDNITENFFQRRLLQQISDDGGMPMELERANSLSYSILNLQFIIDFCMLQESTGNKYYTYHKGIIDKAAAYILSNINAWPYKQIAKVDSEKRKLKFELSRLSRIKVKTDNKLAANFRSDSRSVDEMLK